MPQDRAGQHYRVNVVTRRRPMPSIPRAFTELAWMSPLANTGGRQPSPPILIDIDVVLQRPPPPRRRQPNIVGHRATGDEHPPHDAGRAKSCFSQSMATTSIPAPNGEAAHIPVF